MLKKKAKNNIGLNQERTYPFFSNTFAKQYKTETKQTSRTKYKIILAVIKSQPVTLEKIEYKIYDPGNELAFALFTLTKLPVSSIHSVGAAWRNVSLIVREG